MTMRGKHYLITGASAGLGKALAFELASLGAHLSIAARRHDRLVNIKHELSKKYPEVRVLTLKADVSDKESSKKMFEESIDYFGSLDGVIANAGQSMWSRFRDLGDPDELKDLMQLNYMGVVYSAFYALPHLEKSKGSFVAISSLQGTIPVPYHSGYVASKYAVNGLIETIRQEEPHIHFMLANPSWIAGTELRSHAVSGTGKDAIKVNTKHGKKVMSADECAKLIIEAMIAKKLSIYLPKKYAVVPFIRHILPAMVDKVIKDKVDKQLR